MDEFFAYVRSQFGNLKQSQVDGFNVLLAETRGLDIMSRAYILATAWHETAQKMQPIHERGNGDGPDPDKWDDYLEKYDTGKLAKALGNTPAADGDGVKYAGRGYVQITGRTNYSKASLALGVDLISSPDLAMTPTVAAKIIVRGMLEGWFTGKKLSDYTNYVSMRRIVNGTDRAADIASHAVKFEAALRLIKSATVVAPAPEKPATAQITAPAAPSLWQRILTLLWRGS